ncbi:thiamin catalytic domain protein [Ichthyophthirius multifiliis]|uniref:Thiamin catalytic domain protein n=1 Tax=Ichthyophthirius multifiliis TaxID=5932 RepID=G0QQE9_ICHMU|nr:thiamin catalytic domain protein [Ichthyophthirius multifiliis]EGR32558.1 thiamin catalytic domain protein [Ichthyophthirius multifiliis]|eukprot:XP_004036544.1 thiamin catalytic domain protein [Ichthyophthirius multifiliis]
MMDEFSIATCLLPGKYYYKKAKGYEYCKGVGIIPLGNFNNSKINTRGFKWELSGYQFEFGNFISTSNEFQEDFDGIPFVENEGIVFLTTSIQEL